MRIADPLNTDLKGLTTVCFVCTGNICRSPIAEFVCEQRAIEAGISEHVAVWSAGTGAWHIGQGADARAIVALDRRAIDGTPHRARQFDASWFGSLDYVIALDRGHQAELESLAPTLNDRNNVRLLRSFDPNAAEHAEVPDPYFDDQQAFDEVYEMVDQAMQGLIEEIRSGPRHGRGSAQ